MEGSVEVAGNLSLKNIQVLLDVYHMLGFEYLNSISLQ